MVQNDLWKMLATMKSTTILNFSLLPLVLILELTGSLELGYNVIEQTGKFCPGRDSCRTGGRGSRVSSRQCMQLRAKQSTRLLPYDVK